MSRFIQLHLLTSYPPSNPNRDDLGRPKTAIMGGTRRLRISSQCLKRTWRTSSLFQEALAAHLGTRTKTLGLEAYQLLLDKKVSEKNALAWAKSIAGVFGATKKDKKQPLNELLIEQLVHISPTEREAIRQLTETCASENRAPNADELKLLRKDHIAVDVAMFGRMLAGSPEYNVEAAIQVAHAISVHQTTVESDYFTAIDDLASKEETGSAHIGENEFGAALYYLYICIDRELFAQHLKNEELTQKALQALLESAATLAPSGKQNSYASRCRASYILAEKGSQQPRSLSVAFLKAIQGKDQLTQAIQKLDTTRKKMNQVYGDCADSFQSCNAHIGEGSLKSLQEFIATPTQ